MTTRDTPHFDTITKPWTQIPESAQTKFTHWMTTDPTGQAVAAEADGDLDYALWLIAVELTCHTLFSQPYTTLTDADWRTLYDTDHTPAQAIDHTMRDTQ